MESMKKLLVAMFVALLMAGCGEDSKKPEGNSPGDIIAVARGGQSQFPEVAKIDLVNAMPLWPPPTNRIIAEAIDRDKLQTRGGKGEELSYPPNEQKPYTGWVKWMYENGQMAGLAQFKDGKPDGLWYDWYENGRKKGEKKYKDGYLMSASGGKPNGHQCPEIAVRDGNGVVVLYNNDGTEDRRLTYKDGELIEE
jgi:hypothetical protein